MSNAHRPIRGLLPLLLQLLLGIAIVSLWALQAHGLHNIRNVRWEETLADTPVGRIPVLALEFDADLSSLDVCCGTTSFSLAVVHPKGSPDPFIRFACGPLPRGSTAGTQTHIEVDIRVGCDALGELAFGAGGATASYVHPYLGSHEQRLSVAASRNVGTETGEVIRFAILDQDGRPLYESISPSFGCDTQFGNDTNGSIGVYFDPQGTLCQGSIPAGTAGKIYIVAHLDGATAGGIAGAEFRFTGLPGAWETHPVPDPDILALGDPFGSGVILGFVCKPPVQGTVLLYEVLVVANDDVSDVQFQIESRDPPLSNPCPLLLECDDPVFTAYCVEGLSCFVNFTTPTTCERPIPLGIAEATWSAVKELYR